MLCEGIERFGSYEGKIAQMQTTSVLSERLGVLR